MKSLLFVLLMTASALSWTIHPPCKLNDQCPDIAELIQKAGLGNFQWPNPKFRKDPLLENAVDDYIALNNYLMIGKKFTDEGAVEQQLWVEKWQEKQKTRVYRFQTRWAITSGYSKDTQTVQVRIPVPFQTYGTSAPAIIAGDEERFFHQCRISQAGAFNVSEMIVWPEKQEANQPVISLNVSLYNKLQPSEIGYPLLPCGDILLDLPMSIEKALKFERDLKKMKIEFTFWITMMDVQEDIEAGIYLRGTHNLPVLQPRDMLFLDSSFMLSLHMDLFNSSQTPGNPMDLYPEKDYFTYAINQPNYCSLSHPVCHVWKIEVKDDKKSIFSEINLLQTE